MIAKAKHAINKKIHVGKAKHVVSKKLHSWHSHEMQVMDYNGHKNNSMVKENSKMSGNLKTKTKILGRCN